MPVFAGQTDAMQFSEGGSAFAVPRRALKDTKKVPFGQSVMRTPAREVRLHHMKVRREAILFGRVPSSRSLFTPFLGVLVLGVDTSDQMRGGRVSEGDA